MLLDLEEGLLRKLSLILPPQKKPLKGMAGFQRPDPRKRGGGARWNKSDL